MNIADTISRFANSLDQKDWAGLASVLAEWITVDYSDLRGTKGVVTRAEYISLRAEALSELKTHHLLTNLETREESGVGRCKASALIYRMLGGKFFHSHVIYEFELMGEDDRVEITGIKQFVLWHEGDASIHAGAKGAKGAKGARGAKGVGDGDE